MKKLLLLLLIIGCGEQVREEIIERFPTGEKKIVAKYKGEGNEETMVERTTYVKSGQKSLYENFVDNYEKGYAELNDFNNANNLKEYLKGNIWHRRKYFDEYKGFNDSTIESSYNSNFESTSLSDYTMLHLLSTIEYQDSLRIKTQFIKVLIGDHSLDSHLQRAKKEYTIWNFNSIKYDEFIVDLEIHSVDTIIYNSDTLQRTTLTQLPIIPKSD